MTTGPESDLMLSDALAGLAVGAGRPLAFSLSTSLIREPERRVVPLVTHGKRVAWHVLVVTFLSFLLSRPCLCSCCGPLRSH